MWILTKHDKYICENDKEADYSMKLIKFNDVNFKALLRGLQKIMSSPWSLRKNKIKTSTCWGRSDSTLSEISLWESVFFPK